MFAESGRIYRTSSFTLLASVVKRPHANLVLAILHVALNFP